MHTVSLASVYYYCQLLNVKFSKNAQFNYMPIKYPCQEALSPKTHLQSRLFNI